MHVGVGVILPAGCAQDHAGRRQSLNLVLIAGRVSTWGRVEREIHGGNRKSPVRRLDPLKRLLNSPFGPGRVLRGQIEDLERDDLRALSDPGVSRAVISKWLGRDNPGDGGTVADLVF